MGRAGQLPRVSFASYVVTASYPNGLQSSFTWDSRHRLTALASPAASYSYALDPVGNRTSATETSGRTLSWSYDGVNRLTDESVAEDPAGRNGSVSYTLDPVGNRLAAASTLAGVASSSATYSPDDLLSTESYDLNGNVLATGGRSFAYDSENRLVGMTGGAAGSQVAVQYDGWGNRVAETANGTTTRYLVDDLNPTGYPQVVEELVNGAVSRRYAYGFQRISETQLANNAWTPSFYGYDGMGSVRQLTSLSGAVTDTYAYDAFGNLLASTGTTPNNFLYRGEQYDPALGLEYLRARYYNPATGRFLSKDPWGGSLADPATLHKYSYVGGNPVNYHDPTGWDAAIEEGELDSEISENKATEEGLEKARDEVDCILDTATATLTAIVTGDTSGTTLLSIAIEGAKCTAEARRNKGAKQGKHGSCCFAAGTPVHTDHGDLPVESINVDDEVLSRNSATGKIEYRRVTALTPKHKDTIVDLRVEGEAAPLRPSTDHPFWAKRGDRSDGAWMLAGELRLGDLLQTTTGDWKRIVAVTTEKDAQTVYNFTVDKDHDYFVGETGFLVHNEDCGCQNGLDKLQQFRRELGLQPGQKTLALLEVGGRFFYGISGHGQPISMPINAISAQHAEADAFQQAINAGVAAEEGTLYVDRPLCKSCGTFGGVKGMACALGLSKLKILTP